MEGSWTIKGPLHVASAARRVGSQRAARRACRARRVRRHLTCAASQPSFGLKSMRLRASTGSRS